MGVSLHSGCGLEEEPAGVCLRVRLANHTAPREWSRAGVALPGTCVRVWRSRSGAGVAIRPVSLANGSGAALTCCPASSIRGNRHGDSLKPVSGPTEEVLPSSITHPPWPALASWSATLQLVNVQMLLRWSAALTLVLLSSACDSPTAPSKSPGSPPVRERTLSVDLAGPDTATGSFNGNVFSCSYVIRAMAAGDSGAVATWTGGRVELTPVQGGAAFIDSIPASRVADLFGGGEITPGENREAHVGSGFSFSSASDVNALRGAHTAQWSFRYRIGTQLRSAAFVFTCKAPPLIPVPRTLEIAGGSGQPVTVSIPLSAPLAIRVKDQLGKPYPGVAVQWMVASGEGAKLIPLDSVTDANGIARASLTPGTKAGHYVVSASVQGLSKVEFTLFAQPGPIASFVLSADQLTFGAVGDRAEVQPSLADQFGNRISGPLFRWTSENPQVAETGGGWPNPPGVFINARGIGSTRLTLTAERNATETVQKVLPVTVLALGEVFATDFGRACGATSLGQLYCWGDNYDGALGDGTTTSRPQAAPVDTHLLFSQVSIGRTAVCGLAAQGQLYCWGHNGIGQIGNGVSELRRLTPAPVTGGHTFASVSAGFRSTCAVTTAGEVLCWGMNDLGQLGRDTLTTDCLHSISARCTSIPIPVAGQLRFKSVSVGNWDHTCGVTLQGNAYCWGANPHGQLGTSTPPETCARDFPCVRRPAPVGGDVTFASMTAGFNFTCGLDPAGQAYCWGLGFGPASADPAQSRPVAIGGGLKFQAIDAGDRLVCGLASGGGIYCWGGSYGSTPVAMHTERVYTGLSVGEGRICGVAGGGGVFCWPFDRRP